MCVSVLTPTRSILKFFIHTSESAFRMNKQEQTELEAAAFRRLVSHLQNRTDVQNIDLMNLSGFCRNCLSKWYREEAEQRNMNVELDQARELVYGMPYSEWKSKHQTEATDEQKKQYQEKNKH